MAFKTQRWCSAVLSNFCKPFTHLSFLYMLSDFVCNFDCWSVNLQDSILWVRNTAVFCLYATQHL
jgi:hypothetical protein